MHPKTTILILNSLLAACLLPACSDAPKKLDHFEQLERPPQLSITPQTEVPTINDEMAISNGLGKNIKLVGNKKSPVLKLSLEFDSSWQILNKVLRLHKLPISDRDREQGTLLINYDTDSFNEDEGFFSGLFTDHFGLRKYQLLVKTSGKNTLITASDIGSITTEADIKDNIEEVVDTKIKGPEDSEYRLISTLYKSLRDGFVEPEMRRSKSDK